MMFYRMNIYQSFLLTNMSQFILWEIMILLHMLKSYLLEKNYLQFYMLSINLKEYLMLVRMLMVRLVKFYNLLITLIYKIN